MRFLIDENVDEAIRPLLESWGHEVMLAREVLGAMAPDHLLAILADEHGLVVVTHDKDFKRFRTLLPTGTRRQTEQTGGRIHLTISEQDAVARVAELRDIIEFQHDRARRFGHRFMLTITSTSYNVQDKEPPEQTNSRDAANRARSVPKQAKRQAKPIPAERPQKRSRATDPKKKGRRGSGQQMRIRFPDS